MEVNLFMISACNIKVRYMGDNLVLLTEEKGDELDYLLKEEDGWSKDLFDLTSHGSLWWCHRDVLFG